MNKNLKKAIYICNYQIRQQLVSPRLCFLFLLFFVYFYLNEECIRFFCKEVDVKASPYIFPFLTNDWICQIFISGGFIWGIAPMGSNDEENLFLKFRAGEKIWNFGNCLAVLGIAIVYTTILFLLSSIVLLPNIVISKEWGSIWKTLAMTDASQKYNIQLIIDRFIINRYTPVQAVADSFGLQILCLGWLGLLMYFFNSKTKTMSGLYVAMIFVFLDIMLSNTFMEKLYPFSPVTLVQLRSYSIDYLKYGVTTGKSLVFYLTGIAIYIWAAVNISDIRHI